MRKLIAELSNMRGVSGYEYRFSEKICEFLRPYADDVRTDNSGSVIAVKYCGIKNAPKVMIEAHCDEIGLIVTSVTEEGFLTFSQVGGMDVKIMPSLEVIVHGKKDIRGVIGSKPSSLQEAGKAARMKDLAIDTFLSADEVKANISVGDTVTIAQSVGRLGKKQFSGKSLDNRASLAAIIRTMKKLSQIKINCDVYCVATVQEEVGGYGAKTAAYETDPDIAIAVDVTHGITPDNSKDAFELGSGVVISRGPNLHPELTERLFETAAKHGIKTETEVDGGDTGTDAWEIQITRSGIPTALLSMPLKYMHTSVETLQVSDVKAVSELIFEFISELEEDISWISL